MSFRRMQIAALLLCGVLLSLATAYAQDVSAQPVMSPQRSFRIGYIRQDPELLTTSGVYRRMREFLLQQGELKAAMANAAVDNILLQPFDSHQFLIEAMDAEQLDLAFCSVIDFAYQRGAYEPVFQLRRPGDPHSSSGGRRVWHSGVIFINNQSPLFKMETSAALAELPRYLMQREMAMVGSSSAAGYVYPYLALDRLTTEVPVINARSVFWESSAEVVKAVVNGIHEVGACDASAVDEVLRAHNLLDIKPSLVKVLLRTDPVPRDPVLLHSRWAGSQGTIGLESAALGREMTRALAAFFRKEPGLPRLERTSREPFREVSENLQRFQARRQQAPQGLPLP